MPIDDSFQVRIGDDLLYCESAHDAAILKPVDEIMTTGMSEAYSLEELDRMVVTLRRYDRLTGRLDADSCGDSTHRTLRIDV